VNRTQLSAFMNAVQPLRRISAILRILTLALVLIPLAMTGKPCQGQDSPQDLSEASLEDLMKIAVYSASGYLQSANEAPSSVTVITADEIQKHGFRTLADILHSIRGFYVTYDRNYSFVGVRGLNRPGDFSTRILLLIDGHRLNDNIYDQAMTGTEFPLDIDLIEKVEVIRGPVSSLYGANAFFGIVNVITRKGGEVKGLEVASDVASFNTYQGRISYGRRLPSLEFLVSASFYGSRGHNRLFYPEFDAPETNNGFANHADDDQLGSFFSTVHFKDFTLQALYGSREKGIPTASYGTVFNDPASRSTDAHAYLDLRYDHTFAKSWNLLARVFYDRYVYLGTYAYASSGNPSAIFLNNDSVDGRWWGTELRVSRTLLNRHRITLGSEYRNNIRQDQRNFDFDPPFIYFLDQRSSYTVAAYAQDEFSITKKLVLNAGFRYDYYNHIQTSASPRAALIYRPWQSSAFKFVYGMAFRVPNAYEMYYTSFDVLPNPKLSSETIRTFELVWEQTLNKNLSFSISAYHNKLDHLIGIQTTSDGSLYFANVGGARSVGLELELNGRASHGLEAGISYSLQRTRDAFNHQALSNSPQNLVKLNLAAPLWQKKVFASLDAWYTGRRITRAANHVAGTPVFNLTLLGRQLGRHTSLSAGVYNLFDRKYFDPGSAEHVQDAIRQDGRSFRLKLTWHWRVDQ
jgi:outer membrane receptor for ferrienterochelin and colicins